MRRRPMTDRQADVAAELKARRLQRIAVGDSTAPPLLGYPRDHVEETTREEAAAAVSDAAGLVAVARDAVAEVQGDS